MVRHETENSSEYEEFICSQQDKMRAFLDKALQNVEITKQPAESSPTVRIEQELSTLVELLEDQYSDIEKVCRPFFVCSSQKIYLDPNMEDVQFIQDLIEALDDLHNKRSEYSSKYKEEEKEKKGREKEERGRGRGHRDERDERDGGEDTNRDEDETETSHDEKHETDIPPLKRSASVPQDSDTIKRCGSSPENVARSGNGSERLRISGRKKSADVTTSGNRGHNLKRNGSRSYHEINSNPRDATMRGGGSEYSRNPETDTVPKRCSGHNKLFAIISNPINAEIEAAESSESTNFLPSVPEAALPNIGASGVGISKSPGNVSSSPTPKPGSFGVTASKFAPNFAQPVNSAMMTVSKATDGKRLARLMARRKELGLSVPQNTSVCSLVSRNLTFCQRQSLPSLAFKLTEPDLEVPEDTSANTSRTGDTDEEEHPDVPKVAVSIPGHAIDAIFDGPKKKVSSPMIIRRPGVARTFSKKEAVEYLETPSPKISEPALTASVDSDSDIDIKPRVLKFDDDGSSPNQEFCISETSEEEFRSGKGEEDLKERERGKDRERRKEVEVRKERKLKGERNKGKDTEPAEKREKGGISSLGSYDGSGRETRRDSTSSHRESVVGDSEGSEDEDELWDCTIGGRAWHEDRNRDCNREKEKSAVLSTSPKTTFWIESANIKGKKSLDSDLAESADESDDKEKDRVAKGSSMKARFAVCF